MTSELKACPFCGGEAKSRLVTGMVCERRVSCGNCGAAIRVGFKPFDREDEALAEAKAIAAWNTRSSLPNPEGMTEALADPQRDPIAEADAYRDTMPEDEADALVLAKGEIAWLREAVRRYEIALSTRSEGQVTEALKKCRDKFREYERQHLEKAKAAEHNPSVSMAEYRDRKAKVNRNRAMAEMCEAALASTRVAPKQRSRSDYDNVDVGRERGIDDAPAVAPDEDAELVERLREAAKAYSGMLHTQHAADCLAAAERISSRDDGLREALTKARVAIASLDEGALGNVMVPATGDGGNGYAYPIRDELLAELDAALQGSDRHG